jgi:DnaJ domain
MPCVCSQCLQHAQTLGLAAAPASKDALQSAYRKAARQWHPDRFAANPAEHPEAEDRFKRIHSAYQALIDHHDHPVSQPPPPAFASPAPPPPFNFGDTPGCFTGPDFPADAARVIQAHLSPGEKALAIVDLTHPASSAAFTQFILLAAHAVIVRNNLNIVSLLWYTELGGVSLTDRRLNGQLNRWQRFAERITGPRPNYTLAIFRRDGQLFHAIWAEADDSVKTVIYNFLLRRKFETGN